MAAARLQVETLPVPDMTIHGGRLDEAARRFPQAPLPWIDLSTGINPVPYPVTAAALAADPHRLPDRTALAGLEAAAAAAFGVAAGAIAALPGSEVGLRLLDTIGLPAPAAVVRPGYGSHADALPGARPTTLEDAAASDARTVLLANPNNPDGRLVAPERLAALARTLAARGGWLVVDEAFADAHPDASVLPLLRPDDHVLVLRSFGKFYGIAGVRLGFACGHPAMLAALRRRLGDWPVSSAAIAVGTAAYRDLAWQAATRAVLVERAAALDAVLRRRGLAPRGACPLFRLVETAQAGALFEGLGRAGLLIRPFADRPTWLRIGLPADASALGRLDRALDHR